MEREKRRLCDGHEMGVGKLPSFFQEELLMGLKDIGTEQV